MGNPHLTFLTNLFGWEGSPNEIDYRKKVGTLILTFLLEDLVPGPLN